MKIYYEEQGYLELLKELLASGVQVTDRTGIGSIAMFDSKVVYNSQFPFSTIRPAPLRLAFEEFWMFLRGDTQTKLLEEKGINFWKGNTSREFLDSRELYHLKEGDMGKAYGFQFRNFGGNYSYSSSGFDQLVNSLNLLKTDPYSRRNLVTFWNPQQSKDMALTPCWHSHQLVVLPSENRPVLHIKLINRSLDALFGFPFAVQQYRLYQVALCNMFNFELGSLSCDLTHVHIYNNQIDYAKELITREFGKQGAININKDLNNINDLLSLQWEDIEVHDLTVNSTKFVTPRPPMAV